MLGITKYSQVWVEEQFSTDSAKVSIKSFSAAKLQNKGERHLHEAWEERSNKLLTILLTRKKCTFSWKVGFYHIVFYVTSTQAWCYCKQSLAWGHMKDPGIIKHEEDQINDSHLLSQPFVSPCAHSENTLKPYISLATPCETPDFLQWGKNTMAISCLHSGLFAKSITLSFKCMATI